MRHTKIQELITLLSIHTKSIQNAKQEIRWLIREYLGNTKADSSQLSNIQVQSLKRAILQRVTTHKPLQYIIGNVPFCDLTIQVAPPILIPRPETEEMATWLIKQLKKYKKTSLRILDMCSGSGCIALALAHHLPQSKVIGCDNNIHAIQLAQNNASLLKLTNVSFIRSDLFSSLTGESFDLIVSNPPYIDVNQWQGLAPDVRNWEDPSALIAPDNGMFFYKEIISQAKAYLSSKQTDAPRIILEHGHTQSKAVHNILATYGFLSINPQSDLNGKQRWISAY